MGLFGWSYPPGCNSVPGDEDRQCEVCGGWDIDPRHAHPERGTYACICPECPECGDVGSPGCYRPKDDGGCGLAKSPEQDAQGKAVLECQRKVDEEFARDYKEQAEEEA